MIELAEILAAWTVENAPHYTVEPYEPAGWLGWFWCSCEKRHGGAIARIEADRICLIGEHEEPYDEDKHNAECTAKERNSRMGNCYCGETIIKIHDAEMFGQLKELLDIAHDKRVASDDAKLKRAK